MPGPGGGSRGGGFGRGGGSFGGQGGGFGRGPRPGGFHRPFFHMPFFGFPRPFFGYGLGGGCLGGFMGMLLLPILLVTIIISLVLNVFGSLGSSVSNIANGGNFIEDDKTMSEYCERQYAAEFSDAVEYEDNILLVFLVNDNNVDFYTMAYIGDNIDDRINNMFGGRYSEYGQELLGNLNPNYEDSLSRNLAATVRGMMVEIEDLKLASPFYEKKNSPGEYVSHVKNYSSLEVNEETIDLALADFTKSTDIPIVIVLDDMDNVLNKTISGQDVMNILLAFVIGAIAIYFIVKAIRGQRIVDNSRDD